MTLRDFFAKHECTSEERVELKLYLAFLRMMVVFAHLFRG